MVETVFFPDVEALAVPLVRTILTSLGLQGFRVATQRTPEGYDGVEVIVRADGNTLVSRVVKEQDMAITIYSKDPDLDTRFFRANETVLKLEGGLYALPSFNTGIASVLDLSSQAIDGPNSETEIRYLTFTLLLKGVTVEIEPLYTR